MESPRPVDDEEVIADSEEEADQGDFYPELGNGVLGISGLNKTSSVSMFTTTSHHPLARQFSGISAFTGDPSGLEDYLSLQNDAEKGKGKGADTSITSPAGAFTDFEGISGSVSIADRAKMRQRTQKPTTASDVIEITSDEDDEDELGLKPSTSKTKPKPKPKPKPKAKEKLAEKANTSKVIGAPSDPTSKPRPRPRPRPIPKRPKTTHDGIGIIPASGAYTPPPPSHGPELPIATSPPFPLGQPRWQPNYPNNAHVLTSQLPPSDPPIPSLTTAYNEDGYDQGLPRIETLPGAGGQPSSPSSLFSDHGVSTNKRKRQNADPDPEVDELEPSQVAPDNMDFPNRPGYISPRNLPPPPTFFAGSSSSSMGGGRGNAFLDHPHEPERLHDVVDLTMLPPTIDPGAANKATSVKPKKPRKKKVAEDDENMMPPPMIILDEDEQDEDFDPTGDGEPKKKKAKAKPKEKAPKSKSKSKSKDGTDVPGNMQVEVLITSKPRTKGKNKEKSGTKATTKDKKKDEDAAKGTNKEVFKSREFIEDSDDEADPMGLVGSVTVAQTSTSAVPPKPKDGIDISASTSVSALKINLPAISSSSSTTSASDLARHSRTKQPTNAPSSSSSTRDSDMPKPGLSTSKRASSSNKRKTIFDSDDEDDQDARAVDEEEIQVCHSAPISKKRKTGDHDKKDKGKAKNKGKKVVLSDEEEEEAYNIDEEGMEEEEITTKDKGKNKEKARKEVKKTKALKKSIPDEDDIGDAHVDIQGLQSTPEESPESAKENVVPPPSKASMATPKPPTIPKPPTTNPDGSTPLYARYEIAPRKSSLPMSELIRRANSMPGSPFATPHPSSASSKLKPLTARTPSATAYSPYLKSSRSLLSRIAPLHPNRRTPPPPPPPPPPRKKTKKELEMEEKWEEEMVESVGGMEAWAALPDDERREMRKMKWARELGGWDD